ncbi:MAG: hypothetical protein V1833_01745 [Elusimicrobiota bacterium]
MKNEKKLFLFVFNIVMAMGIGAFFGFFISGLLMLITIFIPYFTEISIRIIPIILYAPIIITSILFVFLEITKTENKVLLFFQGDLIRKLELLLAAVLLILMLFFIMKYVNILASMKYEKYVIFANEITSEVLKNAHSGKMTTEINNRLGIDFVLVVGAYSPIEEKLLKTGKISRNLAKLMASHNTGSEGTYLHLAKGDKVMTVADFDSYIEVADIFQLEKVKDKIKFYVRKEKRKDRFGKSEYEYFVIYKIE